MNKKKLLIIIALCVIAVVSIAIVPTYALYYDEVEFSATIQSRSFDIDVTSTDDLNINVNAGKTFKYGFFTKSTVGNCNFHFTIDTSALPDCEITLSKRVEGTKNYQPVKKTADGSFVDDIAYAPDEARLYLLEVMPINSDLNAKNVLANFSSDAKDIEIKPMDPINDYTFKLKEDISEINLTNKINVVDEFSNYRITNVYFVPRTDNVDQVMIGVNLVVPNAEQLLIYTDSPKNQSDPYLLADKNQKHYNIHIESLSGKRPEQTVDVTLNIYLPTHQIIDTINYHVDYTKGESFDIVLDNFIAENVNIICPSNAKNSSVTFTHSKSKNYSFSKLSIYNDTKTASATISANAKYSNAFTLCDDIKVKIGKNSLNTMTFELVSNIVTQETSNQYFSVSNTAIEAPIIAIVSNKPIATPTPAPAVSPSPSPVVSPSPSPEVSPTPTTSPDVAPTPAVSPSPTTTPAVTPTPSPDVTTPPTNP